MGSARRLLGMPAAATSCTPTPPYCCTHPAAAAAAAARTTAMGIASPLSDAVRFWYTCRERRARGQPRLSAAATAPCPDRGTQVQCRRRPSPNECSFLLPAAHRKRVGRGHPHVGLHPGAGRRVARRAGDLGHHGQRVKRLCAKVPAARASGERSRRRGAVGRRAGRRPRNEPRSMLRRQRRRDSLDRVLQQHWRARAPRDAVHKVAQRGVVAVDERYADICWRRAGRASKARGVRQPPPRQRTCAVELPAPLLRRWLASPAAARPCSRTHSLACR